MGSCRFRRKAAPPFSSRYGPILGSELVAQLLDVRALLGGTWASNLNLSTVKWTAKLRPSVIIPFSYNLQRRVVYLIFLVGALALAIPTFGFSIIAFLFYHNYEARRNSKAVIRAMALSAARGEPVEMSYIGRGAIKKAFEALHSEDLEEDLYPSSRLTTYCGTVYHPHYSLPLFAQVHVRRVPRSVGYMTISVSEIGPAGGLMDGVLNGVRPEMKSKSAAAEDADLPF